jgi:hypothetical protein
VNTQTIGTSVFPTSADFQWQGAADDPGGSGVWQYCFYRNGVWVVCVPTPEFHDGDTLTASTQYTYLIYTCDYHYNISAAATVVIVTSPPGAIDPRRVGVRPTGAYWGGAGEQIDTRSGNVNFTLPLVKALGRGGWGVTFSLSDNSQLGARTPAGRGN